MKEHKAGPGLIEGQEAMFRDKKKLAEFAFEQGVEFNPFAGLGWGIIKAVHTDSVSPVRAAAARILVEDPDSRSGEALARTTSDKNPLVWNTAKTLGPIYSFRGLLHSWHSTRSASRFSP